MVGSEADDDDGDEFERALGRSLEALAAEVSQSGCDSLDEAVVSAADQLAEAMMAMRGAREQAQEVRSPPAAGGQRAGFSGAGPPGGWYRAHLKSGDARAASTGLAMTAAGARRGRASRRRERGGHGHPRFKSLAPPAAAGGRRGDGAGAPPCLHGGRRSGAGGPGRRTTRVHSYC